MKATKVEYIESKEEYDGDELLLFDGNYAGWDFDYSEESRTLLLSMSEEEYERNKEFLDEEAYSIEGSGHALRTADNRYLSVIDIKE